MSSSRPREKSASPMILMSPNENERREVWEVWEIATRPVPPSLLPNFRSRAGHRVAHRTCRCSERVQGCWFHERGELIGCGFRSITGFIRDRIGRYPWLQGASPPDLNESLLYLAPGPKRLTERAGPSASVVVQFLRPSAAHRKSIVHRRCVLLVSQFPRQVASAR